MMKCKYKLQKYHICIHGYNNYGTKLTNTIDNNIIATQSSVLSKQFQLQCYILLFGSIVTVCADTSVIS